MTCLNGCGGKFAMSDFNMTRRQIMAAATAGVAAGPLAALPNGYYVPAEEVQALIQRATLKICAEVSPCDTND